MCTLMYTNMRPGSSYNPKPWPCPFLAPWDLPLNTPFYSIFPPFLALPTLFPRLVFLILHHHTLQVILILVLSLHRFASPPQYISAFSLFSPSPLYSSSLVLCLWATSTDCAEFLYLHALEISIPLHIFPYIGF